MDLHKIHHPANFDFLTRVEAAGVERQARGGAVQARVSVVDLGEEVFRLTFARPRSGTRRSVVELEERFSRKSRFRLQVSANGGLRLAGPRARSAGTEALDTVLEGEAGGTLGFSGAAWMLRLRAEAGDRFFGMGEKWGGLERGGRRSQFWTTDVWADYPPEAIDRADVDCPYVVVPYLIIERRGRFLGLLLDSPYRSFMATGSTFSLTGEDPFGQRQEAGADGKPAPPSGELYLGSTGGPGLVYVIVGPDLRALTRKLQRLVGTTPRPPLWALGHHQSRWGYRDYDDLLELDRELCRHRIPTDGLWLDIDYMDGYRVFSTAPAAFPQAEAAEPAFPEGKSPDAISDRAARKVAPKADDAGPPFAFEHLWGHGRRVVPILDPGVKVEPGYRVHDEGLRGGHFCLSPAGQPYVGVVWPGATYFPDFSQAKTRRFWAAEVARLARRGFAGFWIDMNDPATGPVENESMLFAEGRIAHDVFHNQYGLLMAMATRDGLSRAFPGRRPFVLSRSGFTGVSRFAALWTGDNVSSFRHLRASIPISLNLALSGVPMNGPDVPGFGGDADPQLAVRFYQAAMLLPFLRNHSVKGSRRQEPWAFDDETTLLLRHLITLRYRMLPYLYQLYIANEASGEPIIAPCFIDSGSPADLQRAEDQFFVGALFCAPVVDSSYDRDVELPPGGYYCLRQGRWVRGGARRISVPLDEVPLFVRQASVLPLTPEDQILDEEGGLRSAAHRLSHIEFHLYLCSGDRSETIYVQDDGETRAYLAGAERRLHITAQRDAEMFEVSLAVEGGQDLPSLQFCFVIHGCLRAKLRVNGCPARLRRRKHRFSGGAVGVCVSESSEIGVGNGRSPHSRGSGPSSAR